MLPRATKNLAAMKAHRERRGIAGSGTVLLAALRTCRFEVGCLDQIMFRIHGHQRRRMARRQSLIAPLLTPFCASSAPLLTPHSASCASLLTPHSASGAPLSAPCAPLQTPPPALCAPLKTPSPAFCAPQAPPPPAFCTPLLAGRFIGRRGDLWRGRRDRLLGLSFRHCKQSGSRCEAE